jgi:hypothetical protein
MPLDAGVRARYEPGLGKSLADVRVHTGVQAAASADLLRAEAYTLGRDIVFGASRYRPGTPAGEQLLAHELAHVGQQYSSAPATNLQSMSRPGDDAERAADRAAVSLLAGRAAQLSPAPYGIQRQGVGDVGPGAEGLGLVRQWLEQHQFAPPEEQPREGERHVLLNGEDMPLTQAVQLATSATHQSEETIRSVIVGALGIRMPRSLTGATLVGPGNNVPGLPLLPRTWQDNVALGKAADLDAVDRWLEDHNFRPPEVRDPSGDQVLLDDQSTTMERAADRAFAILGQYPYVRRQEVLVHLRQKYVAARGGPGTQVVLGYTLVPNRFQATTAPDPLNPLRTQHQFSFTITRAHHANDSPGRETSFQGSVALNDSGDIVNLQAGGQEAVVAPLLRGWIQVSGLVQVMAAANWSQTASGSVAVSPSVQAAAGVQILGIPSFRGGPLAFLNGRIQLGAQILGTATAQPDQTTGRWGVSGGVTGGIVLNVPFSL